MPASSPACAGNVLAWRSLALGTVAAAGYLVGGPGPEAWVFDRAAIAGGEWWRLITGHWVHGDASHARWDIAMLILLGYLFEARLKWRLVGVLLVSSAGVDLWLWWGLPALDRYCGLSGILNGLLIAGLLDAWRAFRHPVIPLIAAAALIKIVVEILLGEALLTRTAWPSVPTAHAAGLLSGAAAACLAGLARFRWQATRREMRAWQ